MRRDLYERVCCNLCGADTPKLLLAESPYAGGKLGIVRCRACGLVYRNIRQNEMALSQNYEQWEAANLSVERIADREKIFLEHLKLIEPFRRNNRVLDVGAGHGFFLNVCRARGWDCYGVEPSARAVDNARRNLGLSLVCSTFEEVLYPPAHFDAVTFLNVLEFLPNPKRALQKVQQLLRPGGVVAIRFSNAAFHVRAYRFFSFLGRFHQKLNRVDLAVIHLYAFDKNSITYLLRESGFAQILVFATPLNWTTRDNIQITGFIKQLACRLADRSARFIALVSFGRLMLSPSLTVIAQNSGDNSNV